MHCICNTNIQMCLFRNSRRKLEAAILYNYKQSFKDKKLKNGKTLSSYLWDLKENHNQIPKLTWSIVRFAPGYSNISKRCLLCLHEKLLILNYHNPAELFNKRSELMMKCCHENNIMRINSCYVIIKVMINNLFVIIIAKYLYKTGFDKYHKIAIRDHVRVPKFWRT